MIEIGIVGAKNSGKTTLIEALIPIFHEQELKIATIKHTGHDHAFDTEGKDSYRHRKAGAGVTMALSQTQMAVFAQPDEEFLSVVKEYIARRFDFCLVEGDKTSDRPKVLLTRNLDSIKQPVPANIIVSYGPEQYSPGVSHVALDDIAGLARYLIANGAGKDRKAAVHDQ